MNRTRQGRSAICGDLQRGRDAREVAKRDLHDEELHGHSEDTRAREDEPASPLRPERQGGNDDRYTHQIDAHERE